MPAMQALRKQKRAAGRASDLSVRLTRKALPSRGYSTFNCRVTIAPLSRAPPVKRMPLGSGLPEVVS